VSDEFPPIPKTQIAIFVAVDLLLVAAVIYAVIRHVPVRQAMYAFIALSVLNGIALIVAVVRRSSSH
jgi:hypothetical protein